MPTDAYNRFIESMKIDYYKWHDGEPYDLAALDALSSAETRSVEATLIARADRDWRDIDALARLNTPAAWKAVERVARLTGETALHAARTLAEHRPATREKVLEPQILQAIRTLAADAPVGQLLAVVAANPTDAVRKSLLDATLYSRNPTFRVHAAAILLYLAGQTREPFDWAERPFFLRFATPIPRDLAAAHQELRGRLGA
jgi:hypothetical protein